MNSIAALNIFHCLLVVAITFFSGIGLQAQSPSINAKSRDEAYASIREAFDKGEYDRGEKLLELLAHRPRSSPGFRIEVAGMLVRLSLDYRKCGDSSKATALAHRALIRLEDCERLVASDRNDFRSAIEEQRAFLSEYVLGDTGKAIEHLKKAAKIDPNNKIIEARLHRLNSAFSHSIASRGGNQ